MHVAKQRWQRAVGMSVMAVASVAAVAAVVVTAAGHLAGSLRGAEQGWQGPETVPTGQRG